MSKPAGGPSSYIKEIRSKIGHQLFLLPAVSTLIWNEHDQVLLVLHAHNRQWGTVGGMVEPDEAPDEAARREAFEEVGVTIRLDGIRAAVGGPQHRIRYPNGDLCSVMVVVYDASITGGTLAPDNHEVLDIRWFTRAELVDADLGDQTRALLTDVGLIEGTTP